jgi:hypothetical protein
VGYSGYRRERAKNWLSWLKTARFQSWLQWFQGSGGRRVQIVCKQVASECFNGSNGQTIFVADAHRDNGKRFIVTADKKLRAFLELQRVTRESFRFPNAE